MKIGILTHHWVYNYGANLQTLSTVGYIRKHGHTPIVINWIPEDEEKHYNESTHPEQIKIFKEFQQEYYPLSDVCRNSKEIAEIIKKEKIDKVLIGADTLFKLRKTDFSLRHLKKYNPPTNSVFPNPFWGEFCEYGLNIPIYGFSIASLSTSGKEFKHQKDEIKRYLKRFQYLTVRDKSTSELVCYLTDGEVCPEVSPDPVFNFNENVDICEIEEQVLRKFKIKRDYYLISMPHPYNKKLQKLAQDFEKVVNEKGCDLYELPRQTGYADFPVKQFLYTFISPIEWYILIKNSKGYIGGLMHTIVSCIHNKVPFYSFDYYGTRKFRRFIIDIETSKTLQLIKQCGLEKYYMNIASTFKTINIKADELYSLFEFYDYKLLEESSVELQKKIQKTMQEIV